MNRLFESSLLIGAFMFLAATIELALDSVRK